MAKATTAQRPQTTTIEKPTNGKADPHEEAGRAIVAGWIDAPIEFAPFGKSHKITLTPRRVIQFFVKPTKSGATCTYEQAMKFCQLCKSRGLDPWEGDAFIVGYDTQDGPEFNLVTAHQAFLKRAEACPEFDGIESGVVVRRKMEVEEVVDTNTIKMVERVVTVEYQGDYTEPGDILVGGWARVYRNDRKIPTYRRINLETFDKKRSRWNTDKAGMIVKCAEADALRSTFPNKVGGMYSEEEAAFGFDNDRPAREPVPMPRAVGEVPATIETRMEQNDEKQETEEMDDSGPIPPARQQTFADAGAGAAGDAARM